MRLLATPSRIWLTLVCTMGVIAGLLGLTWWCGQNFHEVRGDIHTVQDRQGSMSDTLSTLARETRAARIEQHATALVTLKIASNTQELRRLNQQVTVLGRTLREAEVQLDHERNKVAALQRKTGLVE